MISPATAIMPVSSSPTVATTSRRHAVVRVPGAILCEKPIMGSVSSPGDVGGKDSRPSRGSEGRN